ncbi:class I SAM-dependent methyltransferase [Streptomyces sp. NBC_01433]|uniref:class I SAM-dependent methyltransferase n=1 Tax=Streptomyces sp. NBC_01433 TaxID=2903864 RepID=UPI002258C477|nr:class I SAM-dependent methyltransferase [Streptomyces sp. NBC_01433]MCX4676038.1 class I SAM-dependent methyltransferase [Streptomyces sp. NBC_01433]
MKELKMLDIGEQYGASAEWSERQIAYYRARADEYDTAYADRMGMPQLSHVLDRLPISGDVLELACGTGQWTHLLSGRARSLTAVDAAPEMLAIARRRLAGSTTRFIEADIFSQVPDRQYDTVFFAFWLSHVPPAYLEPFWKALRKALKPGGCVVFLDDSRAKAEIEETIEGRAVPTVRRRLSDGSQHLTVKVLYDARGLTKRLDALGWESQVEQVDRYHYIGVARPQAHS